MKTIRITLIVISATFIAACSATKKSTTSNSAPPASANNTTPQTTTPGPYIFVQPVNEIKEPGNEDLAALQAQYKEVTLSQLKEGHLLYTESACVQCHTAQSIYRYDEVQWKSIIEDMSQRANISDKEKDAVFKYVLAIKAGQPK